MNLTINNDTINAHIRETLRVPDDHTLLITSSEVSVGHNKYRISATIKIVPPEFRKVPYDSIPWIKISYEVFNVCPPT